MRNIFLLFLFNSVLFLSCNNGDSSELKKQVGKDTIYIEISNGNEIPLKTIKKLKEKSKLSLKNSISEFKLFVQNYECGTVHQDFSLPDTIPPVLIYKVLNSRDNEVNDFVILLLLKIYKCELKCCNQSYNLNDYKVSDEGIIIEYFSEFSKEYGTEIFLSSDVYKWVMANKKKLNNTYIDKEIEEIKMELDRINM